MKQNFLSADLTLEQSSSRILVVDDEDFVREILRDILETEGCEVTVAANGSEALELFASDDFDAVFTDVAMPGMSGWELASCIREQNDRVALGVITGWGEDIGAEEQQAAQVDWIVAKPFDLSRITKIAQELAHRRDAAFESSLITAAVA